MARELNAEDRQAISETLSLHGHLFDGGHLDRLEEIFTPDVVYDLSDVGMGTFAGIEAIRRGALQLGAGNPVAHHVTNVVITSVEDDSVTVQSKGLMISANGTFGSVTHIDTLRRHNGGWRISRRVIRRSALRWAEPTSLTRATGELALFDGHCLRSEGTAMTEFGSSSPGSRPFPPSAPPSQEASYNSMKPPSTRGVYLAKRCFRRFG